MKWEPVVAMVALLALGLWLVWGPLSFHKYELRPGAHTMPVRVGTERGVVEIVTDAAGETTYRLLFRNGYNSPVMTTLEFRAAVGEALLRDAARASSLNPAFRLFNITSWWNLGWIAVGLGGQVAFSGRTIVQWITSERRKESVVPTAFWWMSLVGGLMLFVYFIWRQDVVGVLGQAPGIVIYARNLRLIRKHRERLERDGPAKPET